MHEGASFRTVSRGGAQLVLLAAVALAGVSMGRWVLPEASNNALEVGAVIREAVVGERGNTGPFTLDGPAADLASLNGATPSVGIITSREKDVLRLVAAGRSNRQIAEELQISINTADRHVSNILTKIAAANRAEAASFAVRSGIA